MLASESLRLCVDLSTCITALYNATGSYVSENSWDITDASGAVLISGGNIGSGGDFGNCAAYGCTDPAASNYDANATIDDGSCLYPCLLDLVTLNLYDSYGDGGGSITINGITYTLAQVLLRHLLIYVLIYQYVIQLLMLQLILGVLRIHGILLMLLELL